MNLDAMLLGVLLAGAIGLERHARIQAGAGQGLLPFIGALAILMMIMRGYYWNVFDGRFAGLTYNRLSAIVIFIGLVSLHELASLMRRERR